MFLQVNPTAKASKERIFNSAVPTLPWLSSSPKHEAGNKKRKNQKKKIKKKKRREKISPNFLQNKSSEQGLLLLLLQNHPEISQNLTLQGP